MAEATSVHDPAVRSLQAAVEAVLDEWYAAREKGTLAYFDGSVMASLAEAHECLRQRQERA